ncbi:TrbI F-type domain-containing protein [Sphingobium sp. EM0848]|uniref:TrbI F-type domain-containing protein n=1 Tax=Sphingobium sp. EM0848 TaxID=2743473 RepID=UPI00159C0E9E|nr:TrbI F-type domain-containing protein [Sphingobium sp. EM0848]
MAEQQEFDLPTPPSATVPAAPRRAGLFAGFTRGQLVAGAAIVVGLVWGMWVTKTLVMPARDRIVSARLSAIVGDYVQTQAHSVAPQPQVEADMRRFMAALDRELQRRSQKGEIVMVGEAVLSKNVPDITESIKKAVYASGIARPRQASAEEMQSLQRRAMAPFQTVPLALPDVAIDPMASAPPQPVEGPRPFAGTPEPALPGAYQGASVSTFGGPDGAGGQ